MVHIVNGRHGSGCGFPSAHAANVWLLALLMIHWFRDRLLSLTMITVALLVCYSRVYLGYHYPGDILGGFVLACLVVWLLSWLHENYMHFKNIRTPSHTWVAATVAVLTIALFVVFAFVKL
jgi:undecaprenyl-diphosphatase